jgi:MFS family permease
VGWIGSAPHLVGSLAQIFAPQAIRNLGGRLRLLFRAVLVQAALTLAIGFLIFEKIPYRVEFLLLLLILSALCGGLAGPAWGSLMSDYIPRNKRGQYFGWRSRILGIANVAAMVAAGLWLTRAGGFSLEAGFLVIFLAAGAARFISASYIAGMIDLDRRRAPGGDFTLLMFLARFRESNFVKFVAFVATLTFAAYLASPFFAVFMLRDLGFSYLTYMVLQVISTVTGLIALPLWGRHADVVGNVRVLRLSGFCVTLVPLFWLISHNVFYLAMVQVLAGFAWGGVTLSSANFIYDAVTPSKRVRCISYFNLLNGIALFLGASAGGLLASTLPPLRGYPLLTLFALSSLCRLVLYFLLFNRFSEVRPSKAVSLQELFFSVVGIRPLVG